MNLISITILVGLFLFFVFANALDRMRKTANLEKELWEFRYIDLLRQDGILGSRISKAELAGTKEVGIILGLLTDLASALDMNLVPSANVSYKTRPSFKKREKREVSNSRVKTLRKGK